MTLNLEAGTLGSLDKSLSHPGPTSPPECEAFGHLAIPEPRPILSFRFPYLQAGSKNPGLDHLIKLKYFYFLKNQLPSNGQL